MEQTLFQFQLSELRLMPASPEVIRRKAAIRVAMGECGILSFRELAKRA